MIVVTILGILAVIAVPKFASLIDKTKEGATKGNLGSIRGALTIYYGDLEGSYPVSLYALTTGGKYLSAIPAALIPPYHSGQTAEMAGTSATAVNDGGGWSYVNNTTDGNFGSLWINCSHTDSKGTLWTSY